MSRALALLLAVLVLGCQGSGKESMTAARDLRTICDDSWEAVLRENPTYATYLGDFRYNDRLADISAAGRARRRALNEGFLVKSRNKEHSSELARLHGVRFAFYAETDQDAVFNEARVKDLTGGDTLRARFMGKDFFDIRASWTIIGSMNHLPGVGAGGDSFFRRVLKMDFNVQIPEDQVDATLKQKILAQEAPGVLQWMIEGAKRYLDRGHLQKPESVKPRRLQPMIVM